MANYEKGLHKKTLKGIYNIFKDIQFDKLKVEKSNKCTKLTLR